MPVIDFWFVMTSAAEAKQWAKLVTGKHRGLGTRTEAGYATVSSLALGFQCHISFSFGGQAASRARDREDQLLGFVGPGPGVMCRYEFLLQVVRITQRH